MPASTPKRQHWVPQFYLRYFATPETAGTKSERVWAFSRNRDDGGAPAQFAIKDAAVERHLYSPKDQAGDRDPAAEQQLAALESVLANLWSRLAVQNIPLAGEVRRAISLFLATLFLRHPAQRELQTNHQRLLAQFYQREFQRLGFMPPSIQLDYRGQVQTISTDGFDAWANATANDHHRFFVDFLRGEAITLAKILLKKRWSIILSEQPVFATSDQPVILEGVEENRAVGFASPGATILFPISPTRLLRLDDERGDDGLYYPLCQPQELPLPACAIFNYTIWVNTYRFMFSHRPSDEVLAEVVAFADLAELAGPDSSV